MRLGFISDIHGNLSALKAGLGILRELAVNDVYCLGDTVGYLPDGEQVLHALKQHNIRCQMGNHEEMVLQPEAQPQAREAIYRLASLRQKLPPEYRLWLEQWPPERKLHLDGVHILLVHGSPDDPMNGRVYPDTEVKDYPKLGFDFVVMGHTHHPFSKTVGTTTIINIGSIGLPRDHGDLGSLGLIDTLQNRGTVYRFRIDVEEIIDKYGDQIHDDVRSCFFRKSPDPVGKLLVSTGRLSSSAIRASDSL